VERKTARADRRLARPILVSKATTETVRNLNNKKLEIDIPVLDAPI
jgi:hypothetical protein